MLGRGGAGTRPPAGQFWRNPPAQRQRGPDFDLGDDDAYFGEDVSARAGVPRVSQPAAPSTGKDPDPGADEVDPLDAFMAEINTEIAKSGGSTVEKAQPMWEQQQPEDHVASYLEAYSKATPALFEEGEEEEEEEDGDRRNKAIEPLPSVDHSQIKYTPVQTEFYEPHEEVAKMNSEQVAQVRVDLRISATGSAIPSPVASFPYLAHVLGKELMEAIRRHGYQQPTAIQAQALPVVLSGRDVIGIAETGSGKTVAYLLPMLVHAIAQPRLEKDDGPIGVVLCPTRELAVQIETETYKLNKQLGLRSVTLAGGLSKTEQFKNIKRGAEIAICNPGRLIDIVKMKGCNLRRCTYIVLDEADRMFHMGFEYQVRSIVQNVRPSRQTLLFSATFPPKIEKLARDVLQQPVRITIGEMGQAAMNVTQYVEVLKSDDDKWAWLSKRVDGMLEKGQLLIFVKSIASAEELTQNFLDFLGKKSEFLHGDLDQGSRMQILKRVKKRNVDVLIATDVAARGLDIPSIYTVVSFDVARDIETHTHRIGRTGRAGAAGQAYTLLINDKENNRMAALLVQNLEQANQKVPGDLQALAMKYGPYRAAKLEGRDFYAKKRGQIGGKAEKSAYGVGFDNNTRQKETAQDLAKRLDKEADQMAVVNRQKMLGAKGGRGRGGMKGTGFVAAATDDKPKIALQAPKPSNDSDSSDEDLFAPGVSAAFGKAPPKPPPPAQPSLAVQQQAQLEKQQAEQALAAQRAWQEQQHQQAQQVWQAQEALSAQKNVPAEDLPRPNTAPGFASRSGFSDGFDGPQRQGFDGRLRRRSRSRDSRSRARRSRSRSRGRRSRSRSRGRRRGRSLSY